VTGIIDNSKDDERKRWCELLHSAWMYHQQKVKDDESPIIGKELTDDQLFHMGCSVAIQDAIALIQQMEAYGYFAEGDEEGEDLSKPGPAG
jgi:3-deoxy-D-manno-octulosonate 8-phosphate phosphatase KdsC-like HAD superfamily phosphatase